MKVLFTISGPSSGRDGDSLQQQPRRNYVLTIRHEDNQDELYFERVEAIQITHYRACSREMIASYDVVTDMGETNWLSEVRQRLKNAGEPVGNLCHLRLYLDDGPCYELICHHFKAIITDVPLQRSAR